MLYRIVRDSMLSGAVERVSMRQYRESGYAVDILNIFFDRSSTPKLRYVRHNASKTSFIFYIFYILYFNL